MSTYVELRKKNTPVEYITLKVRYDAWGDPYVKPDFFEELFGGFIGVYALSPDGRCGYDVEWRVSSGPPVRFPGNRESRGWKP